MGDIIIGIHQPNFFPWFGYFLKICRSDKFVFLDDAQTQKKGGSYLNRTKLNLNGESKWVTAPIRRVHGKQIINKTKYLDTPWRKNIMNTLQMNYGNTPHYKENKEFIHDLIHYKSNMLSEFNTHLITKICNVLSLSTSLYSSSSFSINKNSTERLISIIKSVNGNIYLSGTSGDKYQNIDLFESNCIQVKYNSFSHPKYNQIKTDTFISGLSILDLIFNVGIDSTKLIISDCCLKFS